MVIMESKHYDLHITFKDKKSVIEGRNILNKLLENHNEVESHTIKYKVEEFEGNVVVINNVALPVLFQESFTNLDWEKLFDFYPRYVQESEENYLDFPQYCERIAKELDIRKCRGNRNYKEWLKIMMNYVGYDRFEKLCLKYKEIK